MSLDDPRPDRPGRSRGPGRFLAPLALIAVIVVVVVIVASHTGSSTSTSTPTSPSVTDAHSSSAIDTTGISTLRSSSPTIGSRGEPGGVATTATTGTSTAGTYTIASGDTFAVISQKTGVPVTTIEKLNPGVSSSKLSIGQVIKLK